jgi:hypothetical protein
LGGVGGHEYDKKNKNKTHYERSPGRRHRRYSNEDDDRRRKY